MGQAIGMIEVEGVAGIIAGADAACKAAQVEVLGWESIGGYTTVFFRGSVAEVDAGLRRGEAAARELVEHVVAAPMNRPEPICGAFVGFPLDPEAPVRAAALGLIETRGYGAHIHTNDAMVKGAAVEVRRVLTVHNRVVCTLIQGGVGAVWEAIEIARRRLGKREHFLCATVIPQPAPAVLRAFGAHLEA